MKLVFLLAFLFIVDIRALIKHSRVPFKYNHILSDIDTSALISNNYNLAAGSAVVGTILGFLENLKGESKPTIFNSLCKVFGAGAVVFTLFGGFVAFQTSTLRFKFDNEAFSLIKLDGDIGENIVVGGQNAWRYDSFVNYDFLPSEDFPILVYFKETQTMPEYQVEAPIVVDNLKGQAHFFPAIANVQELKANFKSHNCAKLDSPTPIAFQSTKPTL